MRQRVQCTSSRCIIVFHVRVPHVVLVGYRWHEKYATTQTSDVKKTSSDNNNYIKRIVFERRVKFDESD